MSSEKLKSPLAYSPNGKKPFIIVNNPFYGDSSELHCAFLLRIISYVISACRCAQVKSKVYVFFWMLSPVNY